MMDAYYKYNKYLKKLGGRKSKTTIITNVNNKVILLACDSVLNILKNEPLCKTDAKQSCNNFKKIIKQIKMNMKSNNMQNLILYNDDIKNTIIYANEDIQNIDSINKHKKKIINTIAIQMVKYIDGLEKNDQK